MREAWPSHFFPSVFLRKALTMSSIVPLLIQLVSGAVGGNIAGGLLKNLSLGKVINSVVGILGGGLGGMILKMLGISGAVAAGGDVRCS